VGRVRCKYQCEIACESLETRDTLSGGRLNEWWARMWGKERKIGDQASREDQRGTSSGAEVFPQTSNIAPMSITKAYCLRFSLVFLLPSGKALRLTDNRNIKNDERIHRVLE
jgi:hypothetical protein